MRYAEEIKQILSQIGDEPLPTEAELNQMASEYLADWFNKNLSDGNDLLIRIRVDYTDSLKYIYVRHDPYDDGFNVFSGFMTVDFDRVEMSSYRDTVTLRCYVGDRLIACNTMTTQDVDIEYLEYRGKSTDCGKSNQPTH